MLDPINVQTGIAPSNTMQTMSPVSFDQTVQTKSQAQVTTPQPNSDLDQLGQHFLLVANAVNDFSTVLQQIALFSP